MNTYEKKKKEEINDLIIDIHGFLNELESLIRITNSAIKGPEKPSLKDIDNVLFTACGQISTMRNNLNILGENLDL